MDSQQKEKILHYLYNQLDQANDRAKAYVFDEKGERNPTRNEFVTLEMFLNRFLEGKSNIRWLILHGLRGAGKTTLLSQMFYRTKNFKGSFDRLLISVDEIVRILGVSLSDVLQVYEEEILEKPFAKTQRPILLFLDEVQYDPNWAISAKVIYDKSKKVFIIATGSSSLILQTNPDVTRRAHFERLFPMSFTEYLKVKHGKYEIKGLSRRIRTAIFQSDNAIAVFQTLKSCELEIDSYWSDIGKNELGNYIKWGTLPFMVQVNNEAIVYEQTKKTLDKIAALDIPELGTFDAKIISRVSEILYMIAGSDTVSVTKMAHNLGVDRLTLTSILSVLEKTETILRVPPYGSPGKQARKPSKYLFASPAFRSMFFNLISSSMSESATKGKLLEDLVGLYLTRCLFNQGVSLTYDSAQGGADFIIRWAREKIIFEVGAGKKQFTQVDKTLDRIGGKYGLSLSFSPLKLDPLRRSVLVPFKYFLLI